VLQGSTTSECGAVCLAMILAYFGRWIDRAAIREECGVNRDGTNAQVLLQIARQHGLMTSFSTALEPEHLASSPLPAILHWDFGHFVVLERVHRGQATIVDPLVGRLRMSLEELGAHFTGVALYFRPSAVFERRPRPRVALQMHLARLRPYRTTLMSLLALSLIAQTIPIGIARATQVLIDAVLPGRDRTLFVILSIGFAAVCVLQPIMIIVRWRLLLYLRTNQDRELGLHFVEHLLSLPFGFFEQRLSGDLVMRIGSNFTLRELVSERLLGVVLDGATLIILAVALVSMNAQLGFLVILLGLLRFATIVAIRPRQRELLQKSLYAQGSAQSYAVEVVHGILAVKAAGEERKAFERWGSLFVEQLRVSVALGRVQIVADAILAFLGMAGPAAVLLYCGLIVMAGDMSAGQLVGFTTLAAAFAAPFASLAGAWTAWETAAVHLERLREVLEATPEHAGTLEPALRGAIALEGVSFRYGPFSPLVLESVTMAVDQGDFIAIMGPSGSGKSTIAKILLGLHQPTRGRVLVDDCDLREIRPSYLRQQIGAVMQESSLVSGRIGEYIAGGAEVPWPDIEWAARVAEIHDEIQAMPLGYRTEIGENGGNLSGGQRQRIAIARAVLRRPTIILFDEATSALDPETEERIFENIAKLQCTRVLISHRLATVRHASRIVVVDHGAVVESGSPAELRKRGGVYARVFAAAGQE